MPDDYLLDALLARLLGVDLPCDDELAMIRPQDSVQVISGRAQNALWILVAAVHDDTIAGAVVTACEPYRFGDPISCQRRHVHAIAPWAFLSTEEQTRIMTRALTDWKQKWRKQLAQALDRASWESRVQRWHREAFNEQLSPFDLESIAAAYQRQGDLSREQAVLGWLYARALRSLRAPQQTGSARSVRTLRAASGSR
jgi:hypothetical protein